MASPRCARTQGRPWCAQFVVGTDGGRHWQASRLFAASRGASYSFLPSGEGWVALGGLPLLHHGRGGGLAGDGAVGCRRRPRAGARAIASRQLLGWAVLAGPGNCGPAGSILAEATDGGQSWVTVNPALAMAKA